MATEDKAAHKATEIKGDVKENLGKATGDREMEAEGPADQPRGTWSRRAARSRKLQEVKAGIGPGRIRKYKMRHELPPWTCTSTHERT